MRIVKIIVLFLAIGSSSPSMAEQAIKNPLHLTLKRALEMAKLNNAQVIATNERVRQALADMFISRAALLPQLTGIFGGRRQTEDLRTSGIRLPGNPHTGPFNSFDTRGRLTMEIFDMAAVQRLEAAKAGHKLSQAELLKVRQDVLALVGAMFLEAQRADESVGLIKTNLRQMQLQYDIVKTRYKQGTASFSDLDKASVDLAQAQYSLSAYRTHARQMRLDLVAALKIPLDQPIIFEDDTSWLKKGTTAGTSPDVILAQNQLLQSRANEKAVQASFLPSIVASGDYGRSGQTPSAASNTYTLGVSVSVPVWEGGLKQAQLEQAKSKVRENEILLADAKDQNQVKIKEALDSVHEAQRLLNAKLQQLKYAQHEWAVAKDRLKSGLGSQQELDAAESVRAFAEDDKNEAQAVYWTAKLNLAHTMGRIEELFDIQ